MKGAKEQEEEEGDGGGKEERRGGDISLWEFLLQTGEFTKNILSLLEIPQTTITFRLRLVSRDFRHAIPDAVTELICPRRFGLQEDGGENVNDWIRHIACACRHLQTVNLSRTGVTDEGMKQLAANCGQLRIVTLPRGPRCVRSESARGHQRK